MPKYNIFTGNLKPINTGNEANATSVAIKKINKVNESYNNQKLKRNTTRIKGILR